MSSRFIIRWFSGRVTPCSAAITAVCLVAAQHGAQRQAAGHRVGIRIVVQEDEDAVGVAEEALILLDLEAGERAAELGEQRPAEQLRERQVVQLRELRLQLLFALSRVRGADAEHVDQRAAGVPDRLENLLEALAAVVFDDDAGAGREVGFDVGIGAPQVAGGDVQPAVVEASCDGLLSTRNSTSKLGSRISSSILMASSVWQTARHLIGCARLSKETP